MCNILFCKRRPTPSKRRHAVPRPLLVVRQRRRHHRRALRRTLPPNICIHRCCPPSSVRSSRPALRTSERLLRPTPLLIDTALRCVYACPRRADEALELTRVIWAALPSREELGPEDAQAEGGEGDREREVSVH